MRRRYKQAMGLTRTNPGKDCQDLMKTMIDDVIVPELVAEYMKRIHESVISLESEQKSAEYQEIVPCDGLTQP